MSIKKPKQDVEKHKQSVLKNTENYLDMLISDEDTQKRADLLCYWIDDYIRFLSKESSFDPKKGRKYNRGDVVKVHLGYRIGSEEGGLHYCVVLDKDNALSSPVVTVIPLTSAKNNTDIQHLPSSSIYLGNEIYNSLILKVKTLLTMTKEIGNRITGVSSEDDKKELLKRIEQLEKFTSEIKKMKAGSIALTNQIVTISKLRIYDPRSNDDMLVGIKVSNTNLDKIDNLILCNYTNFKK